MIVKNEVDTLPRLFGSCRGLIDYWVICDTGSTDGTQELIRRELGGIPGELHDQEWVDFGVNRTRCMELSRGKAEYLLILDADTIIEVTPGALDRLTDDAYMLRHLETGTQYYTKRLVRGSLDWRYEGAVHEYIVSEQERSTAMLGGLTIRTWSVGAQRSGRFRRDLELLSRAIAKNPDDARAQFYLAQTLRDLGDEQDDRELRVRARDAYARRAEMPGWEEESYCARHEAGNMAARLRDWPQAMEHYIAAWETRPQRLEAVHALTSGLRERRRFHAAHRFAQMAAGLEPLPVPEDLLFVTPWVYEWGMLFEYSITSYWVGEYDNSVAACHRLLALDALPEGHRRATEGNLRHAIRGSSRNQPASA
jgi:tetratricopeptide (TPR) repeat protein